MRQHHALSPFLVKMEQELLGQKGKVQRVTRFRHDYLDGMPHTSYAL